MNRYTLLTATADLSVSRFDHPPHEEHRDPEREVASRWAIAFVRSGAFDVVVGGKRHTLNEGGAFITHPGLAFRCAHHERCPNDVCLSVAFEPSAIAEAEHAWARAGWVARAVPTPRLAYVQLRLAGAADRGDAFEMEHWALAGLTSLLADSADGRARGHYASRRADVSAVLAACRAIEADPAARRTVAERAREVGMTSTRLTHHFRRYLGLSPHQYVVRWRLATAASLLDGGVGVSDASLRSGFDNLSHFCRSFSRSLGVRASSWRTLPLSERRRKVQALLGARS